MYKKIETEKGVRLEFYDFDENPYMFLGRYSAVERILNKKGKVIFEQYLNNGNIVQTEYGNSGLKIKYDCFDRQSEITFVDQNGLQMNTTLGYATVKREYYEDGSIKRIRYFDKDDNPVKSSLGQYGFWYTKNHTYYI